MNLRGIARNQRGYLPAFIPSQKMEFAMEKKNPLLAGLFNMLIPGSGYLYINNDRGRFIRVLIVGIAIQHTQGYPLPQGLCMGILLLIVLVPLFRNGQNAANQYNFVIDNATMYNARQQGSSEAQLARNQTMRDKGLISQQEYDSRKDNISSKK
jgi:hypothetical protein